MVLGLLKRTLCNAILGFVRKMMSTLHYSFGDENDSELPHIVVPLWTAVDRLHVTPPGETPPALVSACVYGCLWVFVGMCWWVCARGGGAGGES